jgi:hypothetical protein
VQTITDAVNISHVAQLLALHALPRNLQITHTRYTLTNFHLPFTDTCEPLQPHFVIRMQASEAISEGRPGVEATYIFWEPLVADSGQLSILQQMLFY